MYTGYRTLEVCLGYLDPESPRGFTQPPPTSGSGSSSSHFHPHPTSPHIVIIMGNFSGNSDDLSGSMPMMITMWGEVGWGWKWEEDDPEPLVGGG